MSTDPLSMTFSALADPTRRAILARLTEGQATVNELAEPFEMTLPAVSKHLKVLERAGLIVRSQEAQWRPCRLDPEALKTIDDWLDHYRRFWEAGFARLDRYLETLQHSEAKASKRTKPVSQKTTKKAVKKTGAKRKAKKRIKKK